MAHTGSFWIDLFYNLGVRVLSAFAKLFGIAYEELAVYVFAVAWPLSMLCALVLVWWYRRRYRLLRDRLAPAMPARMAEPAEDEFEWAREKPALGSEPAARLRPALGHGAPRRGAVLEPDLEEDGLPGLDAAPPQPAQPARVAQVHRIPGFDAMPLRPAVRVPSVNDDEPVQGPPRRAAVAVARPREVTPRESRLELRPKPSDRV